MHSPLALAELCFFSDFLVTVLGATVSNNYFLLSRNFIYYLFLAGLGLHCRVGFSLVVASRIYSLVAVLGALGCSLWWLLFGGSTGSRARSLQWSRLMGSIVPGSRAQLCSRAQQLWCTGIAAP